MISSRLATSGCVAGVGDPGGLPLAHSFRVQRGAPLRGLRPQPHNTTGSYHPPDPQRPPWNFRIDHLEWEVNPPSGPSPKGTPHVTSDDRPRISPMNRALWLLMGLQLRGWFRFLGKNLRTVRGVLLAMVGWASSSLARVRPVHADRRRRRAEAARALRPGNAAALLRRQRRLLVARARGLLLARRGAIPLHRPLLAPADPRLQALPHAPRQRPRVATHGRRLRVQQGWWVGVLLGMALVSIFMQLFSILLGLLRGAVGEHFYSRGAGSSDSSSSARPGSSPSRPAGRSRRRPSRTSAIPSSGPGRGTSSPGRSRRSST